jgi:hypothetical protein
MTGEANMIDRIARPRRRPRLIAALLIGLIAAGAAGPALAQHHGGHGGPRGGGGHGGFFHPGFAHFHSFVFVGAGFYPGFYYGYYPYPADFVPPVYVSPTDCYNTVPRAPGVADLYSCDGHYVGPVAVP